VPNTEIVQTPIRSNRKLIEVIKQVACWNGRSLNSELVLAVEAWTHTAKLHLLSDPAAMRDPEMRERLDADPDFEKRLRTDLDELLKRAFTKSVPPDLFREFGEAA
jgi:hypothetical protein